MIDLCLGVFGLVCDQTSTVALLYLADTDMTLELCADPMMTTFDGRTFEFLGQVGAYYNVISEKDHQVIDSPCILPNQSARPLAVCSRHNPHYLLPKVFGLGSDKLLKGALCAQKMLYKPKLEIA